MSKKVFNVFSILCFALVLCFMGCTELINPKTETDINLKIDLSKIIKSTRNTEETQSSVSIGENPTIKVAIYDAKKYNATTNSTDNLDLITEAQAKIVNNEAKVKLNNIPVGIDAIVFAELSFSNGNSTEVMYAGNSGVFKVKASDNKISLVLMKVEVDIEVKPDDSKPEEIINAKEPIITTQPESHIKIYSSETSEDFTYELKIAAESSDNGKISYKWQKLDNENWVDIENSSLDKITVIVSKNTSCVYRCVVTNTNENVNGEKTASIYSNEVTVAYRENTSVTYAEGLTCKVDSVDTVTLYISNADGLAIFRNIVNGTLTEDISVRYSDNSTSKHDFSAGISQLNINAELENDIDLNNVSWTPIGKNSTDGYKGTFDGANHEIKNLFINSCDTNNPQGLFCSVYGGTVKNLVVEGTINSSSFTGGITGYLYNGTIENCVNKASITNSDTNGTTGGIVGYVENSTATIKNCVNMAKVESTQSTVGGIVGATGVMSETNVSISKCINMGEISALSIVAGILGLAYPITIENCINLGKVISTNVDFYSAAGIVIPSGDDVSVTVTNCINAGNVVTNTNNCSVGAISTSTNGTYTNNYYDSTINSNVLDSDINGITGQLTTELIGSNLSLNGISGDQWSFADNRYPLPDIAGNIPEQIWTKVEAAATPDSSSVSGGGISLNEISSWDELVTKINNLSDDTTTTEFIIMNDLTATSTITVSKPVKIISDEEVTITRGNSSDGVNFEDSFFRVESAGNLELGSNENKIILDGGKANESPILATAPLITSSGNLTLTNCILQNNKNTSDTPGGAINISAGTFTMNGGVIGSEVTENDSLKTYSWQYAATDSKFSNYASAGGGGIYVEDGTVTINGGKISYNYTRNLGNDCLGKTPENTAAGGGISIEKGSLSLINSEVSYNSGYQGGGIRCYNDNTSNAGTLTLNKTLIKGNTSNPYSGSSFGGGLMVKNFKVTFEETTESTIEQNYSGDGGALFLENTTSTLKNITIQNNSYNPNGYHYGSELLLWANANVSIASSDVTIKSVDDETRGIFIVNNVNTLNLSDGAKLDAPIYLTNGATVTVAGYLSSNTPPVATITPATCSVGTKVLTADDTTLLAQCVSKFALSDETYSIDNDGNIVASNQSSAISLTQDYLKEKVKTNTSGDSYYELAAGEYCVSANLTLEYPIQINASGGEVKLYADGDYTISCAEGFDNSANSAMIALPMSAGTLTLSGGEGTLTIDGSGISSLMYLILSQSTLILQDNCTITNGNVTYTAIYVSAGTFTMTGGTITNIHSTKDASEGYGAGIHVLGSNTVVTVSGGSVCNNYNNGTDQGASIYSTSNSITVLDETIPKETLYTYNIVNGEIEDVPSGGG